MFLANARPRAKSNAFHFIGGSLAAIIGAAGPGAAQSVLPPIDIGETQGGANSSAASAAQGASSGSSQAGPVIGKPANAPSTVYSVDQAGLSLATGSGGANSLRSVAFLPSVDAPAIDPFGLANIGGSNKGIRIRGQVGQHGDSISLIDGVPISGINPGPGATFLIDNENIKQVDLYQGAVPSNKNAFFTLPGVIDRGLRWPEAKRGGEISQSVGSSSFLRTFARVDTGEVFNGTTKAFISGSWTDAHEWRGVGKAPQGKSGISVGVETRPTDGLEAKLFFAKSSYNANTFSGLNYGQAANLSAYRWYNFLPTSSPIPAIAVNYAGYNIQSFDSWTLLSGLTWRVNDATRVVIKPYYFREDGYYLDGLPNGMIRKWLIDHDSYGVTSELQTRLAETDFTVGHWRNVQNLPAPPTAWEFLKPNALGGLTNANWPILATQSSPHEINAAYGLASRDFDPFHAQLGVRYIWDHAAGINEHYAKGVGDVSYWSAVGLAPGVVLANSVTGFTVGTFLPYGAFSYDLTKDLRLKISAGGGYGGPAYDAWPAYQMNTAAFRAAGLTANQVWHTVRPENAAMVDWGFRWSFSGPYGSGYIEPTAFYSRNHARAVAYDPGVGVPYSQNVGESEALGAQAMGHYVPLPNLDLFASLGYQHAYFIEDLPSLPTARPATILANKVTGRQLPDVPYWISTVGATLHAQAFAVTPILHIVGERAGDTSGLQPISGYATLDLNFGYERKIDFGVLHASLSTLNVFDTAYIGFINNGYYQQTSSTGIYFPGPPRTVVAKVGFKF